MIIGITGGTGCGKTTLLKEIEARGGQVCDCDAVYHELLTRDMALLNAINDRFPGVVVDKKLERKKLGAIVFSDEQALLDLNAITHGAIKAEILQRLAEKPALAAIDAIGLFEGGLAEICDTTVAVCAPEEDRIGGSWSGTAFRGNMPSAASGPRKARTGSAKCASIRYIMTAPGRNSGRSARNFWMDC